MTCLRALFMPLNLHPEFAFTIHIGLPGKLGQRGFFSTWEAAAHTSLGAAAILKRYHSRPAEELYDLAADPAEQDNLASAPEQKPRLEQMRADLQRCLRDQDDDCTLPLKPRLLSDPASYGPGAPAAARDAY